MKRGHEIAGASHNMDIQQIITVTIISVLSTLPYPVDKYKDMLVPIASYVSIYLLAPMGQPIFEMSGTFCIAHKERLGFADCLQSSSEFSLGCYFIQKAKRSRNRERERARERDI